MSKPHRKKNIYLNIQAIRHWGLIHLDAHFLHPGLQFIKRYISFLYGFLNSRTKSQPNRTIVIFHLYFI